MRFGLSFLPDADAQSKSAVEYFDDALRLSIIADQCGLHAIKMTEHYLHSYGGYCPDPLQFLSAVSSVTQRIRLMTGCVLPVFHHPIQLASRAAMLDVMSHGRLDMGFARAYLPYEFDALGINIDESRDRYAMSIETIKNLWVTDNVSVESDFFKFNNATILPKPHQKHHPPIWGAAVMSRQSFAWLGQQGYNLLVTPPPGPIENLAERLDIYRECFEMCSKDGSSKPDIAISLPLLLDDNHELAIQKGDRYLQHYIQTWHSATLCWSGKQSDAYPGYAKIPEILSRLSPSDMRSYQQALVGSPQHVAEQIQKLRDILGIDYFLWQIDFGAQPYDLSLKTLELFIGEVLPLI